MVLVFPFSLSHSQRPFQSVFSAVNIQFYAECVSSPLSQYKLIKGGLRVCRKTVDIVHSPSSISAMPIVECKVIKKRMEDNFSDSLIVAETAKFCHFDIVSQTEYISAAFL